MVPEIDSECDVLIQMTSCSQCHNCSVLLYDEEIMAGWSPEDSNLNTTCHACHKFSLPFLTIHRRYMSKVEKEEEEKQQQSSSNDLTVPYLNPLVLRKELENILTQEGDLALIKSNFVEEHAIIFWNLLWIMERIECKTYLPDLSLPSSVWNSIMIYWKMNEIFVYRLID